MKFFTTIKSHLKRNLLVYLTLGAFMYIQFSLNELQNDVGDGFYSSTITSIVDSTDSEVSMLRRKNSELEDQINDLDNRVNDLESRIDDLE